ASFHASATTTPNPLVAKPAILRMTASGISLRDSGGLIFDMQSFLSLTLFQQNSLYNTSIHILNEDLFVAWLCPIKSSADGAISCLSDFSLALIFCSNKRNNFPACSTSCVW